MSIFKIIDIYGLSVPLRYNKKTKYYTKFGHLFSLIAILSSLIVILYYCIKVFKHDNFSIIHNTKQLYGKQILNFSRVPLLIGFINDGGRPVEIDSKYINITLDKNDHYPEKNEEGIMYLRRESISIKLEYCNLNKHFNNDTEIINMIKDFEYNKYLCVVPGQNLSIAGRFGDSIHGYDMLEIHLIKCQNTSESQNCASSAQLEEFYKNSYMSILYLSETLNHYDFHNPIKKTFRSEVFMVVSNSVKRYYYFFAPGEYISYNGYLLSKIKHFDFFEYQKTFIDFVDEEDQSYYSGDTKLEVSISCTDVFVNYKRNYEQIQDCFGSITALIRIIYIICKILSDFFSKKIFLFEIINKIFSSKNYKKQVIGKPNFNYNIKDMEIKLNNNNDYLEDYSKNKIIPKNSLINLSNNYDKIKNDNKINCTENSNIKMNTPNTLIIKVKSNLISLKFLDYFFPIFLLRKKEKFNNLIFYESFIYTNISIEMLIPLIERISKINFAKDILRKEGEDFYSKINSTILKNNYIKVKI